MDAISAYKFPHHTCEKRLEGDGIGLRQPVSTVINAASAVILVVLMVTHARDPCVRVTLGTYAAFEAWHAYSHARHIPGPTQKRIVHALGLTMAAATLAMLNRFLGAPPPWYWAALLALVALDVHAVANGMDLLGVATGLAVFAFVVAGRWRSFPRPVRATLAYIFLGTALLLALFVNEAVNCEELMRWRELPYHAVIELLGLALFTGLAGAWLNLEIVFELS